MLSVQFCGFFSLFLGVRDEPGPASSWEVMEHQKDPEIILLSEERKKFVAS